jgi:hypothetical protein
MVKCIRRRAILAVALILSGLVAPLQAEPGNDNRAPDLADYPQLQVGQGHKVAFHAYAVGVQIWVWKGAKWEFQEPYAVLYASDHGTGIVGTHYVGPTWESNSGSYVVGKKIDQAIPDLTAIPWLLLGAVDSDGPGIFDGITRIQRVNTVGGIAPATPGNYVGELAPVPYTADYFFYRKSH